VRNSAVITSRLALGVLALLATIAAEDVVGLMVASHNCMAGVAATGRVVDCTLPLLLFVTTDELSIKANAIIAAMHRSTLEVATIGQ